MVYIRKSVAVISLLAEGPFINYVTLKGGGPFSVTLCDREGRVWSMRIYAWAKIISAVLLALLIYLLGLVVFGFGFLSID